VQLNAPNSGSRVNWRSLFVEHHNTVAPRVDDVLDALVHLCPSPAWISSLNRETSRRGWCRGKVSADAVGGPRLDPVMIVEPVVPMLGSERGPLYHLLQLYWF
jgi:hypothetical protein